MKQTTYDVIIIGAGGAGLMCAGVASQRGRRVLVLDHAKAPGEKIRISGGGRCNFTNLHCGPSNFLSDNPRFCISALKSYTQTDFIAMVERHCIAFHEKTLGQLFCDESANQITQMLLDECRAAEIHLGTQVTAIEKAGDAFRVATGMGTFSCASLVIATGGKSIPKMGATGFGYELAKQFGLGIVEPRPGLVPLTFGDDLRTRFKPLAGVSVDAIVSCGKARFREGLLFTHKGLSGPSILQISSYWREGEEIEVNLAPDADALDVLKAARRDHPKQELATPLTEILPKRLADTIVETLDWKSFKPVPRLADASDKHLGLLADAVNRWRIRPVGTEGYRIAEVTLGGVNTKELSSKTMEAVRVPGLFFIGEVVDVTGHLGGHNFQWAWSSGFAAGQAV